MCLVLVTGYGCRRFSALSLLLVGCSSMLELVSGPVACVMLPNLVIFLSESHEFLRTFFQLLLKLFVDAYKIACPVSRGSGTFKLY